MNDADKEHLPKLQNALIEGKIDQVTYEKLKQDVGVPHDAPTAEERVGTTTGGLGNSPGENSSRVRSPCRMLVRCPRFCSGLALPGRTCSVCGADAPTIGGFVWKVCTEDLWRVLLIAPIFGGVAAGILCALLVLLLEKLSGQKQEWSQQWGGTGILMGVLGTELYVVVAIIRGWRRLCDQETVPAVQAAEEIHRFLRVECRGYVPPMEGLDDPSQHDLYPPKTGHRDIRDRPGLVLALTNASSYGITAITLRFVVFAHGQSVLNTSEHCHQEGHHWSVSIPPQTMTRIVWRFSPSQKARVETAEKFSVEVEPHGMRLERIVVNGKEHSLRTNPILVGI